MLVRAVWAAIAGLHTLGLTLFPVPELNARPPAALRAADIQDECLSHVRQGAILRPFRKVLMALNDKKAATSVAAYGSQRALHRSPLIDRET
jgi:hypothetical protein